MSNKVENTMTILNLCPDILELISDRVIRHRRYRYLYSYFACMLPQIPPIVTRGRSHNLKRDIVIQELGCDPSFRNLEYYHKHLKLPIAIADLEFKRQILEGLIRHLSQVSPLDESIRILNNENHANIMLLTHYYARE